MPWTVEWSIVCAVCGTGSVLAFLGLAFGGFRRGERLGYAAAFGPGIGFGLLSAQSFLARIFLGVALPWWVLALEWLGLTAALFWFARGRQQRLPLTEEDTDSRGWRVVLMLAALGALLTSVRYFLVTIADNPNGVFDTVAIWYVRALQLYRSGADASVVFETVTTGHPDYPLLYPESLAWLFSVHGESVAFAHGFALSFLLGIAILTYFTIRRCSNHTAGFAGVFVLCSTPHLAQEAASLIADLPVAFFLLASAGGLASHLTSGAERRMPAPLVGFFLGCLPWTKDEGAVLLLILVVAFFFSLRWSAEQAESRPRAAGLGAQLLAGAIVPLAAWASFKLMWAPPNSVLTDTLAGFFSHLSDPERWITVGRAFLASFQVESDVWTTESRGFWGVTWPGLLAVFVIGGGWRKLHSAPQRFLIGTALLVIAAWFGIYLTTPLDLAWHLRTSLDRLLLQVLPLLIVAVFSAVRLGSKHPRAGH